MSKPKPRGFAALDPARQREVSSLGGRAVHRKGTGRRFTPEEAAQAARRRWAMRGTKG